MLHDYWLTVCLLALYNMEPFYGHYTSQPVLAGTPR